MYILYRKNGGEILSASTDQNYIGIDSIYFAVLIDPNIINGLDLSIKKIWDGTNVRNALNGEITNFVTAKNIDDNLIARQLAKDNIDIAFINRKAFRALIDVLLAEINTLRTQLSFAPRTMTQAITAIKSKIDSGIYD